VPTAIAVVGDRDPSYLTHRELDAALALMPAGVDARWVATDAPEASRLDRYDALWVVPGTPYRDERPVFTGIERAKFRRPITPGDQLRIEVEVISFRPRAGRIEGKAYVGEKLACEATLTCAVVPRSREPRPSAGESASTPAPEAQPVGTAE